MIKYIVIVVVLFTFGSCETNYGTINTGLANGKFDGSMYEYFQANHYDWDSLVLMIDRAGLKDVFTGERAGYEEITFFGPTNHTIRLWMYKSEQRWDSELQQMVVIKKAYNRVDEIPVEDCRRLVMEHVVKGIYMRDDIPEGTLAESGDREGGMTLTGVEGNSFWIFSFRGMYQGIAGQGAVSLKLISEIGQEIKVASSNLESDNGVVHSLHYDIRLGHCNL
ncbi:MAG: fasciclin domain-containing protein [Butyricimonas faecalis]